MNSKNVLCIFVEDPTLTFLKPIKSYLEKGFDCFIIEPSDESYQKGVKKIESVPDNGLIIFIGHGASHCFYGACSHNYESKPLVNRSNNHILKNKSIFALSCRSSDFLESNKSIIKNYIGFGNLPTEWHEIIAERDCGDSMYLKGITESDILIFKNSLNELILSCLLSEDYVFSFESIFKKVKILINKEIAKLLLEKKETNFRALANLWYEVKHEINANID